MGVTCTETNGCLNRFLFLVGMTIAAFRPENRKVGMLLKRKRQDLQEKSFDQFDVIFFQLFLVNEAIDPIWYPLYLCRFDSFFLVL